ncbi:hypothetical protein B0H13DRAFT_2676645 [Mycena leptocephala]|nr:hypothetical protein B0H13DRAFT_2676645 [Mycena leptocephala]
MGFTVYEALARLKEAVQQHRCILAAEAPEFDPVNGPQQQCCLQSGLASCVVEWNGEKERLQAVKGEGSSSGGGTSPPFLSVSLSGCVKSAPIKATSRRRSEQSNAIPPPNTADPQSPPLPMLSTNLPGVITALVDQPDAAIVPEFYLPHQVTQPMVDSSANTAFNFGRPDLNSACNNADVSSFDQQFPRTLAFNHPLQDLIDVFGIYSTPFDDSFWLSSTPSGEDSSSSPFSFPTAHPGKEEQPSFSIATAVGFDSWPILPPPSQIPRHRRQ